MTAPRRIARRVLAWALALTALAFVVHAVPVRDRCDDPAAAMSGIAAPRLAITRQGTAGCTLLREGGDEHLAPDACATLTCEPGLVTALASARVGGLLPLVALYFAGTLAWAARWRALLALAGVGAPLLRVWRVTLESQAGGILLPGGIGGDALRVGFGTSLAREQGGTRELAAPTATILATVLVDRAVGLVTLASTAVTAALASSGAPSLGGAAPVLAALPVAFVLGLAGARLFHARVMTRLPPALARVVAPVLGYVGHPAAPRALARAAALSLLVSASQFVVVRGIVAALGVTPSAEGLVYVGATMAFMVAAVPGLPGGWGTSDAAFVYFLGRAGIAPSSALAVSLVYRLFWYGSGGVGALLFLVRGASSGAGPLERRVSDAPRTGPS